MVAIVHTSWLSTALSHLPSRLHAALDGWSQRLAAKKLEQRRAAISSPANEESIPYTPKPWRD